MEQKLTGYASIDKPWEKYYTPEQLSISIPEMSLTEYIYDKNKDRLDLIALNYLKQRISYEELFQRIEDTSKKFIRYGVKEEDYVGLAMPLTPEAIYMMYALDNIGANANLIDPRIPEDRMKFYLNLAEIKLAGIISPYISTMRDASSETSLEKIIEISPFESVDSQTKNETLKKIYTPGDIRKLALTTLREEVLNNLHNAKSRLIGGSKIVKYSQFKKQTTSDIQLPQYNYYNGKTAICEYTSGTTGIPKGVLLTASGMNVTAEQLSIINNSTPGETILAIMPPFISYGAVTGIHNSLGCGFEMILISNFSLDKFAKLVKDYKPNNIICVPSMFESVISNDMFDGEDMSCIKRLIFGGDKTPVEFEARVNNWLRQHNSEATLIKGGGMAEYSSCAFETPYEETKKPGIYGIPLPLVEAKIMKDDFTECKYGEIGEIYICAPQAMKGYINNPSETEAFFYTDENGKKWGRSGDLGFVSEDGTFTLTSRKKQMIVRPDGHNVFPNEIEDVINNDPRVKMCVVVGVKDSESVTGEYPVAFIEIKEEFKDSSASIINNIQSLVASQIPVRDRPRKEDYIAMDMVYAQEGKLDRTEMVRSLKR